MPPTTGGSVGSCQGAHLALHQGPEHERRISPAHTDRRRTAARHRRRGTLRPRPQPAPRPPTVIPSRTRCAACRAKATAGTGGLVFALGQLGYDLVSEARRDSIQQNMDGDNPNPFDSAQLVAYLNDHGWDAASILWTLNFEQIPLYAIEP